MLRIALIFVLILLGTYCSGEDTKKLEMEAVTKEMTKLHLGMNIKEVEQVVGKPYWQDGDLVGEKGPGCNVWQICPEDVEKSKDGKVDVKFLFVRIRNDRVVQIKEIMTSGMIGAGR